SSAYGKIASDGDLSVTHSLRITGVGKGSFHILIEIATFVQNHKDQVALIANVSEITSVGTIGAAAVVKSMMYVMRLVKHTQKLPYEETINADNQSIIISNSKNVKLEVPITVYNLFKNDTIQQDLSKIVQPLESGKIDSTTLVARINKEVLLEEIKLEEKKFFEAEEVVVTETKEMWLQGILNSLTKTTNRGFLLLGDGTRVSYRLVGKNPENLYPYFIHKGLVKVRCKAHLDSKLKPAQIEIYEIQSIQGQMDFPESLNQFLKDNED
ncbi:MAG: hypothetical protein JWN18_607, partial [Parcubacteria group bacterium]|nr:hypothetical protein [Parcubacteria group bacterium]